MSAQSNMDGSKLHELLGRALREQEFADRVLDPASQAEALKEMGIEPTPEVIHEVNHSADHLRNLWQTFGADPTKMAS